MVKCAFYGSLRKGHYNYKAFGGDKSFKYIGTEQIPGFVMYSLGAYPMIFPAKPKQTIVVDLFEVPRDLWLLIDRMELSAGYRRDHVKVGDDTYVIYVGEKQRENHFIDDHDAAIVPNGDWSSKNF